MSEFLLRITYLALGIYTFASALLTTTTILSRTGGKTPVELFNMGSLWVSFVAFVLIVSWASKAASSNAEHKLPESFLRVSFLSMGLLFFTCAFATTMAFSAPKQTPTELVCVCGLWLAFVVVCTVVCISQRRAGLAQFTVGPALPV